MDINSNSKTYNGLTAEISEDLAIDSTNVKAFTQSPSNVKFVMIANKDKFYDSFQDSDLDGLFDNFGVVSVPLLNVEQTKKMFKEQPKLMEKIKKTFTPDAIDKSIEAANKLKGNYPEKAQKVMDLVSSYHIDKDKIMLVTDSSTARGLPDGEYVFLSKQCVKKGTCFKTLDGHFAGSVVSINDEMKVLYSCSGSLS